MSEQQNNPAATPSPKPAPLSDNAYREQRIAHREALAKLGYTPYGAAALVRSGRILAEKCGWTGPWRIDLLGIDLAPDGSPEFHYLPDITAGRPWY